jgi:hypothetical protein
MSDQVDKSSESGSNEAQSLVNINVSFKGLEAAAPHLEKFLSNIVKALSRGVGQLYSPLGRVREAKADAKIDEIRAKASINREKSRFELQKLHEYADDENHQPLEKRAIAYLIEDTSRKQSNREKIAEAFIAELGYNIPYKDAERAIEDDWLTQFWKYVENVDNRDVHAFYARLLSGEVAKPRSVSPLTLRTLSVIGQEVAEEFQRFSSLSIDDGKDVYVIHPHVFAFQSIGPLDQYGISYDSLFEMEAYGLIRSAQTMLLNFSEDAEAKPNRVDYAGSTAFLNLAGKQIQQLRFTRAGREIRRTMLLKPIAAYTETLKNILKDAFTLEVNDSL